MRLLDRLASPLKGYRLLRRLLVELRAIHKALDRSADAQELLAGHVPRDAARAQVFRSYTRTRGDLSEREVREATEVSYVDTKELAGLLAREEELRGILGRDPTPEETLRAYHGDIE